MNRTNRSTIFFVFIFDWFFHTGGGEEPASEIRRQGFPHQGVLLRSQNQRQGLVLPPPHGHPIQLRQTVQNRRSALFLFSTNRQLLKGFSQTGDFKITNTCMLKATYLSFLLYFSLCLWKGNCEIIFNLDWFYWPALLIE